MNAEPESAEERQGWAVLPKLVALGDRHRTRKLWRSLFTWLVVVVVLVSLVGMTVNWILVDRKPQDPVESWLQSMVNGSSRQGLATFSTGFGYSGASALPNRVYRAAEGRIDRWEITDVQTSGDSGQVSAKVWWADGEVPEGHTQGEEHSWNVLQERRTGPFNDSWVLQDHESATLNLVSPGISIVTINGVNQRLSARDRAVADGSGGLWTWEAMPGQFVVDLPSDGDYVLKDPIEPVTVGLDDPSPREVRVELEPSPNLWAEVDQAIADKIEGCMSQSSVAPSDCPGSQRWADGNVPNAQAPESPMATPTTTASATPLEAPELGSSINDVQWELVSRPSLWLIPNEDTGSRLDWKASEHSAAQARLTYLEDGRRVEETINFPVHVNVTSDGSNPEIIISLD